VTGLLDLVIPIVLLVKTVTTASLVLPDVGSGPVGEFLSGLWTIEELGDLFEGERTVLALGLEDEEVHEYSLEREPDSVND
jgi:hypothetical protein